MQNVYSLVLKLREQFEVTDGWILLKLVEEDKSNLLP